MKIALAQINYHIGNFEHNTSKIIHAIDEARQAGAELVVFAELAVSGYPPRDFLEFDDFIERCLNAVDEIATHCKGIAAIVGCPTRRADIKGKDLHNSAIFLADGKVQAMAHKSLLPNYDIFDEYRYFEPYREFEVIAYGGKRIALTICEDIWDVGEDPLYTIKPMDELIKQSPDVMINIAASPFHYEQARTRKEIILTNVRKYKLPLFYVNHVGAQTELLFDGGSLAASPEGFIYDELEYFAEDLKIFDLDDVATAKKMPEQNPLGIIEDKTKLIHDAIVMGIKNYFGKLGFDKAILGLSGGIDSAVTMVLAARALGREHVRAMLLPSAFSSEHSVNDAVALAENLGSPYDLISIEDAFDTLDASLQPVFGDLPFDIAEENIQARIRGLLLMAMSNKFGHILLNTSNKSEAAVGYSTLYGDMNGGLSVLGDVYKTEVFKLARYINKDEEIIPENTITKPPSAELRPDQKDSDSLPEYDILDEILYQYIEKRKGPKELVKMGFEKATVDRILKLVNTSEYKRYQTPPMLRVSSKAFGMGRRMPIVAKYLS
ncbi:MAG: NAD+ synthase [Bacteroidetes bacterium]|nr:MAG: NAD+ synthase [Bacteroidota bacterium]